MPALLFEGAWALSLRHLRENWRAIVFLAGPGALISVGVIGGLIHLMTGIDWATALLLGALPKSRIHEQGPLLPLEDDQRRLLQGWAEYPLIHIFAVACLQGFTFV